MTLGKYLKTHREKAGLTQAEVAKRLGYTTAQLLSNVERDLYSPPLYAVKKLCKWYGMDITEIKTKMFEIDIKRLEKKYFGKKR